MMELQRWLLRIGGIGGLCLSEGDQDAIGCGSVEESELLDLM